MSLITKPTKVTLGGVGTLTLRQSDYLTQGGEGAIYRKGNHVIKLFLDAKKMKQSGKTDKVSLLAKQLRHDSIVAPSGLVLGSGQKPIGYYMPYVAGEAYPRLFTNDFRKQMGFGDQGVAVLTEKMRDVTKYAHAQGAVMADANELNWLADLSDVRDPTPYVIDVDSWEIDRFKATVIMPSIRDWHATGFSPQTDWFAWGVVSFLLFTGIHPYKGKLDGYKPGELERRMKDNASVFLPEVRLNKAVRDFSCIPGPLLDWYQETFQNGFRGEPPSPLETGTARALLGRVMRTVATKTGGLVYEELLNITGDPVVSVWPCGIARTKSGDLYQVANQRKLGHSRAHRLAVTAHEQGYILAESTQAGWQFRFIAHTGGGTEHTLPLPLPVEHVVRSGERLFAVTEGELVELSVTHFKTPLITTGKRWQILGNATKWYRGVGVTDALGANYLVAPYGSDAVAFVRTPELDDRTVIDAIAGTRYVEAMTITPTGEYEVLSFSFDSLWRSYTLASRESDTPELNTAILEKGVTASIAEDGELVVAVPFKGEQKVVNDKDLFTTMRLSNIGDQVVYRAKDALWSLRMR